MEKVIINLGCGTLQYDNTINVDIRKEVQPNIIADARYLPFKPNTIDIIEAKDLIEHFTKNEAKNVLSECKLSLKKDGILRLTTPYFDRIIEFYKMRIFSEETTITKIFGRQEYNKNYHYHLYNPGTLSDLMLTQGWSLVTPTITNDTNFIIEAKK